MHIDTTHEIDHYGSSIIGVSILDPNKNIQLCAFGMLKNEKEESYLWFFENLFKSLDK